MPKAQRYSDRQDATSKLLTSIREEASALSFPPRNVVRCAGFPVFRTQAARDLAVLLDLDPTVTSWSCLPLVLTHRSLKHVPDFAVLRETGSSLVDAIPSLRGRTPPNWAIAAADALGYGYETHQEADLRADVRFENARDLLQYAAYRASLGDRVRILGLLEEYGSVPLSTCLQVVRNGNDAIGVVAALVLRRFIEMDLDEARIGPETRVSAFRG